MKLLDNFFVIRSHDETASGFEFELELNPGHVIYQGHFPGHPVTPGVIQLQMVQELVELKLNQKVRLAEILQSKFLQVLNPRVNAVLTISIDYQKTDSGYSIKALGKNTTGPFLKLECRYHQ